MLVGGKDGEGWLPRELRVWDLPAMKPDPPVSKTFGIFNV